jgi:methylmalonyl-CoA mutase
MTEKKDKLFPEFPPVSTSAWEEKIREDLKGADYEKKLVWKTVEGITIKPYYRWEDISGFDYQQALPGAFPWVSATKKRDNGWHIRQQVWVEDIAAANSKALDLAEKGITSLEFVFSKKIVLTQHAFEMLLQHIPLHVLEINFAGYNCEISAEMLMRYIHEQKIENTALKGAINFDPLGRLCKKGHYNYDSAALSYEMLVRLIKDTKSLSGLRTIGVNARNFGNAGASITQELAFGLAMGAEYLSILTDQGLSVNETAAKMVFHFAVSQNYFMEIAKYRAVRLLWAKVVEAFDPGCHEPMYIHAETARWNLAIYDPYVNMLRTTTESMSAILAGIDALTVLPFDIAFEKPSEFAERIARNQQIIVKEESYFDRVIDPAAGSYYIESLTKSIAAESWKWFLAVQQEGGFVAAMKQGFIQEQVKMTARQRDLAIATRREFSIGTNQYPDFEEAYAEKPLDFATECGCTCIGEKCTCDNDCCCGDANCHCDCMEVNCDCSCCNEAKRIIEPLRLYRGTKEFEKLRLKTDLGKRRPRIFMLTIGNLSMRLARSRFSCNFFACAGYEVIDNIGFSSLDDGISAAVEAKADIVVLCSSDDEYVVFAPEAYEKLNGRAILVIAGAPPCMEDLKAKGIDNFIHLRSNVLETLKQYHQKLGIVL